MEEVAIVGAGELGGLLAHVLARRNAAHVRLIDDNGRAAEGKALDIMQAAPIEGFAARVSGSADVSSAAGAAIIAIADPFGAAEWPTDAALLLLKRLREFGRTATLLCASASHRDLVERGVRELHIDRRQLFGSAPEALAAAARSIVAVEIDGSPHDVALTVLGVPPQHVVIPWEDASIAGLGLIRALDEPARRRIDRRIAALWPPGPYALATAAAAVIDLVLGRTRRAASCFVAPDDSEGRRYRAAALPIRVGGSGMVEVGSPALTAYDRVRVENAMLL